MSFVLSMVVEDAVEESARGAKVGFDNKATMVPSKFQSVDNTKKDKVPAPKAPPQIRK